MVAAATTLLIGQNMHNDIIRVAPGTPHGRSQHNQSSKRAMLSTHNAPHSAGGGYVAVCEAGGHQRGQMGSGVAYSAPSPGASGGARAARKASSRELEKKLLRVAGGLGRRLLARQADREGVSGLKESTARSRCRLPGPGSQTWACDGENEEKGSGERKGWQEGTGPQEKAAQSQRGWQGYGFDKLGPHRRRSESPL